MEVGKWMKVLRSHLSASVGLARLQTACMIAANESRWCAADASAIGSAALAAWHSVGGMRERQGLKHVADKDRDVRGAGNRVGACTDRSEGKPLGEKRGSERQMA
jgi:hypothetical protein